MLRTPVRYDEALSKQSVISISMSNQEGCCYLETQLCFQQAVLCLAIRAPVGVVDAIVRTHNVPRAGFDSVLEGPKRDKFQRQILP